MVVRANDRDFVVNEFTTGRGPTEEKPGVAELERVRYYAKYPCLADNCTPFADIRLRGMSDSTGLLYEIHLPGEDGEAHPGTLRTIVHAVRNSADHVLSIQLGRAASGCWPQPDFKFPPAGKLQIGVRPVDLAGNQGPLLRLTVDLDHPIAKLD